MTTSLLRSCARAVIGLGLLTAWPASVGAQTPTTPESAPPSPAVFGGARRKQPGVNSVTFSTSVLGGYDTNVFAGGDGTGDDGFGGGGSGSTSGSESSFAAATAQLQWSQQRETASFFGNVGGQYRRFIDLDDFDIQAYNAGTGMSVRLTPRSSLALSGHVSAQPFYQWSLLGGGLDGGLPMDPTAAGESYVPDFQATREQALRYGAGASYSYRLGPRTSFSAAVQRSGFTPLNDEAKGAGMRNLGVTTARATLSRRLTENLGARMGYGYMLFDEVRRQVPVLPVEPEDDVDAPPPSTVVDGERYGVHLIDVGLDYSRSLRFARRTSFSFGTGSSISRQQNADGTASRDRNRFFLTGFATLHREFLRTWGASLNYTRGTSYAEGLNEFLMYDATTASVGGQLSDRLDARASASWSSGRFRTFDDRRLWFLSSGAQLRYGFSPNIAAFVAGTYTRRELPEDLLTEALARDYRPDRKGIRVGLTFWFDLLR